jgi:hypothetical protein
LIDGVFGLLVTEKVACHVCGRETHKVPAHYEHLIVVNSASLNLSAMSLASAGMDQLLAFLFEQEQKFCDKDEGGCGEPNVSVIGFLRGGVWGVGGWGGGMFEQEQKFCDKDEGGGGCGEPNVSVDRDLWGGLMRGRGGSGGKGWVGGWGDIMMTVMLWQWQGWRGAAGNQA